MRVPEPRGPLSRSVGEFLLGSGQPPPQLPKPEAVIGDGDAQLALWTLYELHYRGFDDVPDDLEWDPTLLGLRRRIERRFETELRAATHEVVAAVPEDGDIAEQLLDLAANDDGPSVAAYLQRQASAGEMQEYLRERSIQQLKESDPHSFVLGRLDGPAKVALAELQYDEYGAGRPDRLHATLYADALAGAGLDRTYGAYINEVSGRSLTSANAMSMFAMQRRLRAAAMGHLAAFEATSSVPCRKISGGLARLGFPESVATYFDEHVEADAVHEHVAAGDICGALVREDPRLRHDVLFGAATCLYLDRLMSEELLQRWTRTLETV